MGNIQSLSHSKWECIYHKRQKCYSNSKEFCRAKEEFYRPAFLARGYHVSTVGRDEDAIRKYIKDQEKEDRRIDQLNLFDE